MFFTLTLEAYFSASNFTKLALFSSLFQGKEKLMILCENGVENKHSSILKRFFITEALTSQNNNTRKLHKTR